MHWGKSQAGLNHLFCNVLFLQRTITFTIIFIIHNCLYQKELKHLLSWGTNLEKGLRADYLQVELNHLFYNLLLNLCPLIPYHPRKDFWLSGWLTRFKGTKSCPGHHQHLQLFTMQGIHLKEVTNCSWLLSKWCFCQNWDTGSALLMTLSDGRREVALMLIGSTFNLLLIVLGHKRCCH